MQARTRAVACKVINGVLTVHKILKYFLRKKVILRQLIRRPMKVKHKMKTLHGRRRYVSILPNRNSHRTSRTINFEKSDRTEEINIHRRFNTAFLRTGRLQRAIEFALLCFQWKIAAHFRSDYAVLSGCEHQVQDATTNIKDK